MTTQYPEHAKLLAVQDRSQAIGDFLDWATMQDVVFGREVEDDSGFGASHWIAPVRKADLDKLLARFFGIDQAKLQAEKDDMYRYTRERTQGCQQKV